MRRTRGKKASCKKHAEAQGVEGPRRKQSRKTNLTKRVRMKKMAKHSSEGKDRAMQNKAIRNKTKSAHAKARQGSKRAQACQSCAHK